MYRDAIKIENQACIKRIFNASPMGHVCWQKEEIMVLLAAVTAADDQFQR